MPAPDLETLAARVDAHDESLRAISDTVVDLTKEVRGISRRMDHLEGRMDGLDGRMDRLDGRMDRLEVRVDGIQTTVDQHTGMLTEILHILRAPGGAWRAGGEGDPPSPRGHR